MNPVRSLARELSKPAVGDLGRATSNGMKKQLVFFGTAEFVAPLIDALLLGGWEIPLVVTTPDEPAGRGNVMTPPPVKLKAEKLKLKAFQPLSLKDPTVLSTLRSTLCPVGVVAAYGKIIPQSVIDVFPFGIINVHPSLLPKYRGPTPVQAAIMSGDSQTGVSIMKIDSQMDHGPILTQETVSIGPTEKFEELNARLWALGSRMLTTSLPDYVSGKITPLEQDHSSATFCKLITRDDGKVDIHQDPRAVIYNKLRAFGEWPGVWFLHKGKRVKILDAAFENDQLSILKLQPEGKRPMTFKDFINGYGFPG